MEMKSRGVTFRGISFQWLRVTTDPFAFFSFLLLLELYQSQSHWKRLKHKQLWGTHDLHPLPGLVLVSPEVQCSMSLPVDLLFGHRGCVFPP